MLDRHQASVCDEESFSFGGSLNTSDLQRKDGCEVVPGRVHPSVLYVLELAQDSIPPPRGKGGSV